MIDLEPFIGDFQWQIVQLTDTTSVALPDMMCVFRFIILCIIIRYFIKAIFTTVHFFL